MVEMAIFLKKLRSAMFVDVDEKQISIYHLVVCPTPVS